MAACTPCKVDFCLTAPQTCERGAPGGWSKLWFANRCDLQSIAFEAVQGNPRGRIKQLVLKPGAKLLTAEAHKQTGLQFDTEASDENGLRFQHTLTIPLINRSAEAMATLKQMTSAELIFIGLHRDGRYWAAGIGEEGFQLQSWNDTKGRLATDGAVMEASFSLTDRFPQTELLWLENGQDAADLDARAETTAQHLEGLVDCGTGSSGPTSSSVTLELSPALLNVTAGINDTKTVDADLIKTACAEEVTLSEGGNSNLPAGLFIDLPLSVPDPNTSATIEINSDGSAAPGTYFVEIIASADNCGQDSELLVIEIV